MNILHLCWGLEPTNGAANIARRIMGEQRAAGHSAEIGNRYTCGQIAACDELWCHCGWYWRIWMAVRTAKRLGKRVYWMPECCYDPVRLRYHGWKKRLVGPFERWALRRADVLVATCRAEADWIRAYEPRVKKIIVSDIKRFFDLGTKAEAKREKRGALHVLYLGRLHPLKGTKYLEEAVRQIAGVELRMVSNHTGEELERDWEWCDVFCLPTLSDNFGLVVAEALERGKRVITTDGAPAWESEEVRSKSEEARSEEGVDSGEGGGGQWWGSLIYLRGFRDGDDATRVKLLKEALGRVR